MRPYINDKGFLYEIFSKDLGSLVVHSRNDWGGGGHRPEQGERCSPGAGRGGAGYQPVHRQFADYIWDQAGVLSDSQERDICLYNANWVQRYDSLIALAVVDGVSGDIGDYAYSLGEEIELASSDGILVIDVKNTNGYLAVGPDYPMTDQQVTNYMDQSLYEYVAAGEYGEGVLNLFADVNQFYVDNYGLGYLDNANHYGGARGPGGW